MRKTLSHSHARCDKQVGRSAEHGFTLVELMVVIVIIGLLATIVAINVIPATDTARVEKAKADISTIEQALEQYRLDNLTYPAASDGLQALLNPPASLAQPQRYRRGGYIKKLPQDPWGRAYLHRAGQEGRVRHQLAGRRWPAGRRE
jgi:general secretion pathway protein G